ncbi:MAG: hypothetical protein ABI693_28745 [Bryobacteraceae bacterium]
MLQAALARGIGSSPEEVIERALEAAAASTSTDSGDEQERRRHAVAGMLAFPEEFHLTLGPGESIQGLVHKGHKY